jgi:hypothetical protein
MNTRKLDPSLGTQNGLPDELNGDKQSEIDQVEKWSEPPQYTPPWDNRSDDKNDKSDEVIDHLFVEKFDVYFVDQIRGDGKEWNELEHQ